MNLQDVVVTPLPPFHGLTIADPILDTTNSASQIAEPILDTIS